MKYKLNYYEKKNGNLMLFLNAIHNGKKQCSIGIAMQEFAPFGDKTTVQQKEAVEEFLELIDINEHWQKATIFFKDHKGKKGKTWLGDVFISDHYMVGDYPVDESGCYLYRNGSLINIDKVWFEGE